MLCVNVQRERIRKKEVGFNPYLKTCPCSKNLETVAHHFKPHNRGHLDKDPVCPNWAFDQLGLIAVTMPDRD